MTVIENKLHKKYTRILPAPREAATKNIIEGLWY